MSSSGPLPELLVLAAVLAIRPNEVIVHDVISRSKKTRGFPFLREIGIGLVVLASVGLLFVVWRGVPTHSGDPTGWEQPVVPLGGSAFPLALYDVPLESLPALRGTGFTHVHLYDSEQSLSEAIYYLAAAQAADLQVIQNMPSSHDYDDEVFWTHWVSTLASYDSLAWWYLPEEPRRSEHDGMRRLYEIIHEHDPKGRPAAVYFGTTRLEGWCDVADIIMVPAYPEYHRVPRAVARAWLDIARDTCPDKVVVSVQALFDTNFDGTGDRPTPLEMRADAYTAIIAGSQGLAWYSFSRGRDLPDLWPAVQQLVEEVDELTPVIVTSPYSATVSATVVTGPAHSPAFEGRTFDSVQLLQKNSRGTTFVFAVNLAEAPLVVELQGLPQDLVELSVEFEARSLPVLNGIARDDFAPAAAHIYTFSGE